jgi:DNA-directed RNA polymerase subunit M/transcription elongation factor TFIIS
MTRWTFWVDLMILVGATGATAGLSFWHPPVPHPSTSAVVGASRTGLIGGILSSFGGRHQQKQPAQTVVASGDSSSALASAPAPQRHPLVRAFWFRRRKKQPPQQTTRQRQTSSPDDDGLVRHYQETTAAAAAADSGMLSAAASINNREQQQQQQQQPPPPRPPVHLMQQQPPEPSNNNIGKEERTKINNSTTTTTTTIWQVHTYQDITNFQTYKGLNTSLRKFQAYLSYILRNKHPLDASLITTTTIEYNQSSSSSNNALDHHVDTFIIKEEERQFYQRLWESGRLITDRTEWLLSSSSSSAAGNTKSPAQKFADLLQLYTDRVWGFHMDAAMSDTAIRDWLASSSHHDGGGQKDHNNDDDRRHLITADQLRTLSLDGQKQVLKQFLEWFRSHYPYYYDRCEHCGASKRDDDLQKKQLQPQQNSIDDAAKDSDEKHDDDGKNEPLAEVEDEEERQETFIGHIYANAAERLGKAVRTELYQCHSCHKFTRFPRYNSVRHVIEHRRGRCGEYSMLLYRTLQYLGHDARWVVDWADHVWAEIYLDGQWIHLDPCEAAVDEKLLYQQWGKRQVYIVAFYLPPPSSSSRSRQQPQLHQQRRHQQRRNHALIEDVTERYTTESLETIHGWRGAETTPEHVAAAIDNATKTLEQRLGIIIAADDDASSSRETNATEATLTAAVR